MKKIFSALVFMAICHAGFSQDSTAQHHSTRMQKLKQNEVVKDKYQELNLSEEQKQSINKIKSNAQAQRKQIEQNSNLSATEKQEQLQALRKQTKEQIEQVLTNEQKQQLKEANKKRKENKSSH